METQKHTIDGWLKNITAFKTHRILLRQEGRHMYMHNLELKQTLRYNFKENQLEVQHYKTKEWNYAARPYKFFRDFSLDDLVCPQAKIKVLIKYTKAINTNCNSLATLFNRMEDVMIYENYIEQRIKHEKPYMGNRNYWGGTPNARTLEKPLSYYPKNFITLCKETGFEIDRDTEKVFNPEGYDNHAPFIKKVCDMLVNSDFYTDQKLKIIEAVVADFKTNIEVLHNRGYELKTLFKNVFAIYVRNEGMKFEFAIDQLKDYYNMARIVKKHAEKYPKYLRSTHDIVEANFEVYEEERKRQEEIEQAEAIAKYDEDKRVELEKKMASMQKEWKAKKRDFLKYNGNANFIVTVPETPMELVQEGTDLSHCVASYVDDVKLGRTYIFFLRNKDKPFDASVTLEYKSGVLTTARGDYNRDITWAERDFLQSYCELKKIEFSKIIPDPKGDRPDVTVKKLTEWDNKKTDEWFLKVIKKKAKEDAKTDAEKAIKYREDNNE